MIICKTMHIAYLQKLNRLYLLKTKNNSSVAYLKCYLKLIQFVQTDFENSAAPQNMPLGADPRHYASACKHRNTQRETDIDGSQEPLLAFNTYCKQNSLHTVL